MPDKYDEVALEIAIFFGTDKNGGIKSDALIKLASRLRSAFPPPAEDAMQCADKIAVECIDAPGPNMFFDHDSAAAEISRFAESRVEPWRGALQALYDEQNGAPLLRHAKSWEAAMAKAEALLSDSPAKEAAR